MPSFLTIFMLQVSGPEPVETNNIIMLIYLSGLYFTIVICFLYVIGVAVVTCLALLGNKLRSGNLPSFDGCRPTSSVTHTPYEVLINLFSHFYHHCHNFYRLLIKVLASEPTICHDVLICSFYIMCLFVCLFV